MDLKMGSNHAGDRWWGRRSIIYLVIILTILSPILVADEVFFADNNHIYMSTMAPNALLQDATFTALPMPFYSKPKCLGFDPVDRMMYWGDGRRHLISRAYLNETSQEIVARLSRLSFTVVETPISMSLELLGRKIYWKDHQNGQIERANFDGSDRTVLLTIDTGYSDIVADGVNGHLYWSYWGRATAIERSNLDGSDRRTFVQTSEYRPTALCIDLSASRLYWSDFGYRIDSIDLDGTGRTVLHAMTGSRPYNLAVRRGVLHWLRNSMLGAFGLRNSSYIGSYSLRGTDGPITSIAGLANLHIITHENVDYCSSSPCAGNSACVNEIYTFQCVCPGNFTGRICDVDTTATTTVPITATTATTTTIGATTDPESIDYSAIVQAMLAVFKLFIPQSP